MTAGRFAVIGTAGHIDHGKTALVRRLTGIDTDRLKEEKERGISIDLGFAHLTLPDGTRCGIVDVPGHERFVKNMLAGVGGIDAVLLVVAADEGVMPQTREHFDIIRLLGVTRGVVALTKSDMVEPDWLEYMAEEVRDYLRDTPFADAPVVPVSSKTGAGREALLTALADALADLPERAADRPARLPVDRVFVVEGFGTVATGTLWRGRLRPGDRIIVEPGGLETRLRSVQVHGLDVPEARAGQRTAVALHGVDKASIERGQWVLAPGSLAPAFMIDVRLTLVAGVARPLTNRQRVRFHLGASELLGRVILLDRDELAPGESTVAQVRLESPVVADRGDHFVIRSYSPQRAIGGGVVLVPDADKHRRHDPRVVARLEVEEEGGPVDRLRQALDRESGPVTLEALARAARLDPADADPAADELRAAGAAVWLTDGRLVARRVAEELRERTVTACRKWQSVSPFRWGMPRGDLKSQLPREVDALFFDHLVDELVAEGRLFRREDRFREGTPESGLTDRERDLLDRVSSRLAVCPFAPPSVKELDEELRAGIRLIEALNGLVADGRLVKVTTDFYYERTALEAMAARIREYFARRGEMRVADLKDLLGISRKHAVPVLEYFDRSGITRRMGDVRVAGRDLGRDTSAG